VLAEDDAEFVVIAVFVLVACVVECCVVEISFDMSFTVSVLLSRSVALAELINKIVATIKIIVPK